MMRLYLTPLPVTVLSLMCSLTGWPPASAISASSDEDVDGLHDPQSGDPEGTARIVGSLGQALLPPFHVIVVHQNRVTTVLAMAASRNRIPKKMPPALPWRLPVRAIPRAHVIADDSAIQGCQVSGSSSGCGSPVTGSARGSCGAAECVTTSTPASWDIATLQVSGSEEMWSRG
jgi:hypothetical protein